MAYQYPDCMLFLCSFVCVYVQLAHQFISCYCHHHYPSLCCIIGYLFQTNKIVKGCHLGAIIVFHFSFFFLSFVLCWKYLNEIQQQLPLNLFNNKKIFACDKYIDNFFLLLLSSLSSLLFDIWIDSYHLFINQFHYLSTFSDWYQFYLIFCFVIISCLNYTCMFSCFSLYLFHDVNLVLFITILIDYRLSTINCWKNFQFFFVRLFSFFISSFFFSFFYTNTKSQISSSFRNEEIYLISNLILFFLNFDNGRIICYCWNDFRKQKSFSNEM